MSDTGRMIVFCFCGLALVGGFLMLFGGGTVLVQERTEAALPSSEQVEEVKQVEQVVEVEQVKAPAKIEKVACDATCLALRKACFYMLADVSVNGAALTEGLCTSSQAREWEAADTACQVSLITKGACE